MGLYRWTVAGALLLSIAACAEGTGPVTAVPASITIVPAADTLAALQDTARLTAEVRDGLGTPLPGVRVEWRSLDAGIVTVDSLGRAVARDTGTARIVAAAAGLADTARIVVSGGVAESALNFVRLATGSPPLVTRDTSFWAVRGDGRRLEIDFAPTGGEEGEEFLEFEVPGESLLRYPDGRAFQNGDSVRIRVRVEESRFLFEFEPAGLRFDPDRPARLRVRYRHARPVDLERESAFFLWRREQPGAAWVRIASIRIEELDDIRAELTGFTAFSLAIP